jgi:hypothetical protein
MDANFRTISEKLFVGAGAVMKIVVSSSNPDLDLSSVRISIGTATEEDLTRARAVEPDRIRMMLQAVREVQDIYGKLCAPPPAPVKVTVNTPPASKVTFEKPEPGRI